MRDIAALRLYARVARLGSFSAAAREFGLSQPQVSRMIADLETDLGARLLTRTTRAVVLTEAGGEFLGRVEPILAAIDEAQQSVREGGELQGLVRMSMPTSFGVREVIPKLQPFLTRHPNLRVQMLLEDRRQDLVRDAVDVAIRVGRLVDSTATVRRIASIPRVIIAAPAYLDRAGAPATPADLAQHRIVGGPAAAVPNAWVFEKDGQTQDLTLEPFFTTNENEAAVSAARAGLGITSTTGWACRRELAEGSLVRLLPDWRTTPADVHAYFPMGKGTRLAARATVEHLIEALVADPLPF